MVDAVADAVAELANGNVVVVVDREGGGDLLCAAQFATPALVSFLVRHTSGYLSVALSERDADRLGLPPLVSGEAHAVTVDARHGAGTGISARDRAHTARLLADSSTEAGDLTRPGHVVPLRARDGGVLVHAGRAEAAVDLLALAGLRPAALMGAVVSEQNPIAMASPAELAEFAARHGLCITGIDDLRGYLRARHVECVESTRTLLCGKQFRLQRYRDAEGLEHVALSLGAVEGARDVPVRVHAECLVGDVFGSFDCKCGAQLRESIATIAAQGCGLLVYVREGAADAGAVISSILHEYGVWGARAHGPTGNHCLVDDEALRRSVIGTVGHGDRRGRLLGFPTANLHVDPAAEILDEGVYGGLARVLDEADPQRWHVAAISVGTNPTFSVGERRFEVHLLDFDGDLYGRRLEVIPLALLRPTLMFNSTAALIAQIEADIMELRQMAEDWVERVHQLGRPCRAREAV